MPVHKITGVKSPEPGHAIRVNVDGTDVAVFNQGGRLFAIAATCTHEGGPLDEGDVESLRVTCPWHGSVFDIQTGRVLQGPAEESVKAFRVRAEDDALIFETSGA